MLGVTLGLWTPKIAGNPHKQGLFPFSMLSLGKNEEIFSKNHFTFRQNIDTSFYMSATLHKFPLIAR